MANAPDSNVLNPISSSSNSPTSNTTQRLTPTALAALSINSASNEEQNRAFAPPRAQGSVLNLSTLRSRLSRVRPSKKSTGTRSSVSSVPVLVRSYPAGYAYGLRSSNAIAAGPATTIRRMEPLPSLPPVAEFAFSHVLLTVDSDIQDPLEAISSICARSRYSLADEYGAHLPPFNGRPGLFIRTNALADSALSVVQEASNSSAASDTGTMRSAYGSLRNVLSRRGTERTGKGETDGTSDVGGHIGHTWAVKKEGKESIVLIGEPQPSRQVITERVAEVPPQAEASLDVNRSWLPIPPVGFGIPWLSRRKEQSSRTTTAESVLRSLLNTVPAGLG